MAPFLSFKIDNWGAHEKISQFVDNLVGSISTNPRDLYRYINTQKTDTQRIPLFNRRTGIGVTKNEAEQARKLKGQFTNVFNKKSD